MITYNFKYNTKQTFVEVPLSSVTISRSHRTITAFCDASYTLSETSSVKMETPFVRDFSDVIIETEDYSSIGIIRIKTKYKVYTTHDGFSYIDYKDGRKYYSSESYPNHIVFSNEDLYPIIDNEIYVNDEYFIGEDTLVTFDERVFSIIAIYSLSGNNKYICDIDLFDTTNEQILPKTDYTFEQFEAPISLTRITITNDSDIQLNVVDTYSCGIDMSIQYKGEEKPLVINYSASTSEDYVYDIALDDTTSASVTINALTVSGNNYVIIDNIPFVIHKSWVKGGNNGFTKILLDEPLASFEWYDTITAVSEDAIQQYKLLSCCKASMLDYLHLEDDLYKDEDDNAWYIIHNSKIYPAQETDNGNEYLFVVIDDSEYELMQDKNGYYCNVDDKTIYFDFVKINSVINTDFKGYKIFQNVQLEGNDVDNTSSCTITMQDGKTFVTQTNIDCLAIRKERYAELYNHDPLKQTASTRTNVAYGIKRYNFINIDGTKYKVYGGASSVNEDGMPVNSSKFIITREYEEYVLNIVSVEGKNNVICLPEINYLNGVIAINGADPFDINFINSFNTYVARDIYVNFRYLKFYLTNNAFGGRNDINFDRNVDGLSTSNFRLFKELDYISIPLTLDQNNGFNLQQEDLVNSQFTEKEFAKAINPIIDMEKDTFSPFYHDGTSLKEVSKIVFDLHFRTRDLETWKTNEDYTTIHGDAKDYYGESTVLPKLTLDPTMGGLNARSNWFSLDYYPASVQNEALEHSDLLYFLNFIDNDVFYQKSKVTKSFLRLMFYDSPHVETQSLLYQCVVWLNGNNLYKTYINNISSGGNYTNISSNVTTERISTATEPTEGSKFTFREDQRLSSQIVIENRYNSKKTSEGFYLYLFKELTKSYCPRTIYMKIMFNHAGQGQSCLMMLPSKIGGKIDVDALKKGVKIEEFYKKLYIPIQIKMDEQTNSYIYYPLNSNAASFKDGTLSYNLFEIKMADESY